MVGKERIEWEGDWEVLEGGGVEGVRGGGVCWRSMKLEGFKGKNFNIG